MSKYFSSCPGNIVVIRCRVLFTHLFWNRHVWVAAVFFQNGFRHKINLGFLCLNCELFSLRGCIFIYLFIFQYVSPIYLSQGVTPSFVPLSYFRNSDLLTQLVQTDIIFTEREGGQTLVGMEGQ